MVTLLVESAQQQLSAFLETERTYLTYWIFIHKFSKSHLFALVANYCLLNNAALFVFFFKSLHVQRDRWSYITLIDVWETPFAERPFKRCPANNSAWPRLVGHVDLCVCKEVINMKYECIHQKKRVNPPTLLHPLLGNNVLHLCIWMYPS